MKYVVRNKKKIAYRQSVKPFDLYIKNLNISVKLKPMNNIPINLMFFNYFDAFLKHLYSSSLFMNVF